MLDTGGDLSCDIFHDLIRRDMQGTDLINNIILFRFAMFQVEECSALLKASVTEQTRQENYHWTGILLSDYGTRCLHFTD